jgi:hypothetical protein
LSNLKNVRKNKIFLTFKFSALESFGFVKTVTANGAKAKIGIAKASAYIGDKNVSILLPINFPQKPLSGFCQKTKTCNPANAPSLPLTLFQIFHNPQ